ncbi:MAG: branched-chain amino acid transport system II carrier protein [Lactobacillales bacterium]|jgi:LIVCS family branched-chain amino acid:cation transporter|nr:branched-chain amino acid transport system II carrier protein [Lactobacillales bacterium]
MKEKKLSIRDYLFVGSMLFGLFFGAGNLIFPVNMGQNAGQAIPWATLGLLVTAVGLPFLGVIAMGISGENGVHALASKVNKKYAAIFTILLYLTIGPFFALPRLATTSFTIGLAPFIATTHQKLALAIFSILFFAVAWVFSRKPTKILIYVGKFLNPIFLILLAILLLLTFLHPLGSIHGALIQPAYQENPFITGFTEGYNTLDALASLAFGIIVISTLKNLGVTSAKGIAKDTFKSGIVVVIFMSIIYTALAFAGTTSLGGFKISENGGIALAQLANHYMGISGSLLLALIVIIACLKTGIGLITAFSEATNELFPTIPYKGATVVAAILPALFANVGLNQIIKISLPVLMFLYPLAITLIILTLVEPLIGYRKPVFVWVTGFTLIAALFDALNACPEVITTTGWATQLLALAKHLPFFSLGMGWLVPAIFGFLIGFIFSNVQKKKK